MTISHFSTRLDCIISSSFLYSIRNLANSIAHQMQTACAQLHLRYKRAKRVHGNLSCLQCKSCIILLISISFRAQQSVLFSPKKGAFPSPSFSFSFAIFLAAPDSLSSCISSSPPPLLHLFPFSPTLRPSFLVTVIGFKAALWLAYKLIIVTDKGTYTLSE